MLSQPKRLALLVYLATARPHGFHSRDSLLGRFWPESDADAARNSLRQSLHFLRRSLGEDVIVSRGERELGLASHFWSDAAEFDRAAEENRYGDVLRLYRGEFMPGFFIDDAPEAERWIEDERAHRQRIATEAAWALASREESQKQWRAAGLWARQACALNPLDEAALRRLIGLLDRAGEPAAAVEAYEEFERRLRGEFELEPAPETVQLVSRLKQQPRPAQPSVAVTERVLNPADLYSSLASKRAAKADAALRPVVRSRRRWPVMVAVLLLATSALLANWPRRSRTSAVKASMSARTIAVMPFLNLSGDPANEYFSDGITEEILTRLAGLEGLRVAARSSSFAYKGRRADVRAVGEELGVAAVLEGSVRRSNDHVKISAQLVNAADGYHIWSQTFDRKLDDVLAVQEEIAHAIAQALELELGADAKRALLAKATASPQAYDHYLRGQHLVSTTSRERNEKAIEHFEAATKHDRRFALAYAGLARAFLAMAEFVPPREVLPRAKQAAQRALQLDSSLVETRLALADVRQVYDRDWVAAELEIQRALELDPTSAAAHGAYADFLLDARRFGEAERERGRMWELRARQAPDTTLPAFRIEREVSNGGLRLYLGDPEGALRHARAALDLDPMNLGAQWLSAITYQRMGRPQEAIPVLEAVGKQSNHALPYLTHLGRAYAEAGRTTEARAVLDSLHARARRQYVPRDQFALLQFALADTAAALASLRQAINEYHWWMPNTNAHPIWAGLQSHPQFRALMRQIGAPQ